MHLCLSFIVDFGHDFCQFGMRWFRESSNQVTYPLDVFFKELTRCVVVTICQVICEKTKMPNEFFNCSNLGLFFSYLIVFRKYLRLLIFRKLLIKKHSLTLATIKTICRLLGDIKINQKPRFEKKCFSWLFSPKIFLWFSFRYTQKF